MFRRSNIYSPKNAAAYLEKRFGGLVVLEKFNQNHDVRGRFTSAADSVRNAMRSGKPDEKTRQWIKKHKLAGEVSIVNLKDVNIKVIEKSVSQKDYVKKGYSGATSAIAYELSKELGFTNFPITTLMDDNWTIRSQFIEGNTLQGQSLAQMKTLLEEGHISRKDAEAIAIMAYLKHDPDMHGGNVLADKDGRLWAIDMDGWSFNKSSEWKEKRRGLSKVMSGEEVSEKHIKALKGFVDNEEKIYQEKFKDSVPEKEWKVIVRRAGKIVKKGYIP